MFRCLWYQTRDIRIDVFSNKVVYNIPLHLEPKWKQCSKIVFYEDRIELTITPENQAPIPQNSVESSLHNPLNESEPSGGSDICSQSHQHPYREMK